MDDSCDTPGFFIRPCAYVSGMYFLRFAHQHCRDCGTKLEWFICGCGYQRPRDDAFNVESQGGGGRQLTAWEHYLVMDVLWNVPLPLGDNEDIIEGQCSWALYLVLGQVVDEPRSLFDLAPLTPAELLVRPTLADDLVRPSDDYKFVDPHAEIVVRS